MTETTRFQQAAPRLPEEIAAMPAQPAVAQAAVNRGVTAIVHFTRIRNLTGILHGRALLARDEMTRSELLRYVNENNCIYRRDPTWTGYISMSVGRVNPHMFTKSLGWHRSEESVWVILEFAPQILGHPGVVFTSTNNAYAEVVRGEGAAGFELMFGDTSHRWTSQPNRADRTSDQPTDSQAEVLYPHRLSTDHLTGIIVADGEHEDTIMGMLCFTPTGPVPIRVDPGAFS